MRSPAGVDGAAIATRRCRFRGAVWGALPAAAGPKDRVRQALFGRLAPDARTWSSSGLIKSTKSRHALTRRRRLGLRVEQFRKCDLIHDGRRLLEKVRYVSATIGFRALGPDALRESVPDLGERPRM